jgi:regulatory protein
MKSHTQNTSNTPEFKGADKKKRHKREKRPPKKITEKYLYNAGLAYLQRFTASTEHFRKVMGRKIHRSCLHHKEQDREACDAMLDKTIAKLQELALLDDTAYAKGMVTSYRNKGFPASMILLKLQQKGLTRDQITAALSQVDEENAPSDYIAGLRFIRRKRLGAFKKREKEFEKELAALARNGYSYDLARKILETPLEEAEDIIRQAV